MLIAAVLELEGFRGGGSDENIESYVDAIVGNIFVSGTDNFELGLCTSLRTCTRLQFSTCLFLKLFPCFASIFHQNHPPFTVKIKTQMLKVTLFLIRGLMNHIALPFQCVLPGNSRFNILSIREFLMLKTCTRLHKTEATLLNGFVIKRKLPPLVLTFSCWHTAICTIATKSCLMPS